MTLSLLSLAYAASIPLAIRGYARVRRRSAAAAAADQGPTR